MQNLTTNTKLKPGLGTFYAIQPGKKLGLFTAPQSRDLHGARRWPEIITRFKSNTRNTTAIFRQCVLVNFRSSPTS